MILSEVWIDKRSHPILEAQESRIFINKDTPSLVILIYTFWVAQCYTAKISKIICLCFHNNFEFTDLFESWLTLFYDTRLNPLFHLSANVSVKVFLFLNMSTVLMWWETFKFNFMFGILSRMGYTRSFIYIKIHIWIVMALIWNFSSSKLYLKLNWLIPNWSFFNFHIASWKKWPLALIWFIEMRIILVKVLTLT